MLPLLAVVLLPGCHRAPRPAAGGPVVLITLDALRADVVGGLGGDARLTPNLARFAGQADWAGRAIAASSWGVPAMASLFTGLSPWQHHAILDGDARLADDLLTLPKAFKALGYRTAGFSGGRWLTAEYGYDRGFDTFDIGGKNRDAAEVLAALEGGKDLVWVHVTQPDAPFVRRAWLLPRLAGEPPAELAALPRLIEPVELEAHADPRLPLAAAELRRLQLMYRWNVAWADEKVGRLLDAVQASGQWDRALVVVTADYGEEMGEHGVVGHGDDLARESLEVPLLLKLPSWYRRALAPRRDQRVAATRIWATLVEAAGGTPPPAMAPSLFHAAPAAVLSELYSVDGANLFSLVEGDEQLVWEERFAPPEPRLFAARRDEMAGAAPPPGSDGFGTIASRLYDAFAAAPPLAGAAAAPRLALLHWGAAGGSRVEATAGDAGAAARAARLARQLAVRWGDFVTTALPPAAEDRLWADQLPADVVAAPGGGG